MKPILIAVLVFVLSFTVQSQPNFIQSDSLKPRGTFRVLDAKMIDILLSTIPSVGSNSRELLKSQTLKPFLMPTRQMGKRGVSSSYALASCLEFYNNLNNNYKVNLSPDYISLSNEKNGQPGNTMEALSFLGTGGTVSAAIMPYDAGAISTGVYATSTYKIKQYLHIIRSDTRKRQKVFEARKALMRGHPVIVDLKVDASFKSLVNTKSWEPSFEEGEKDVFTVLVVGYDEEQQAFEIQSCLGIEWGNNGYLWIGYDDFGKYVENAYVMVPLEN